MKILRALNGEDMGPELAELIKEKKDHWRYKLAIMHRVNIKEIFARQKNFLTIVQTTLSKLPEQKLKAAVMAKCDFETTA